MKIERLQFISQQAGEAGHLACIARACEAGVKWVQLRVKDKPASEVLEMALESKKICNRYNARLIVNDYPEIAAEAGAYGVHLGSGDMPVALAREITGEKMIIGATANTMEDIERHQSDGADYVGLGPYRFTETKKQLSPLLGLEGYTSIMAGCQGKGIKIPVLAIGGIRGTDIPALLQSGVYGIAVSSVIAQAADMSATVVEINEHFLKLEAEDTTC